MRPRHETRMYRPSDEENRVRKICFINVLFKLLNWPLVNNQDDDIFDWG